MEAIGANALVGVRENLAAVWDQAVQKKGLGGQGDRASPPMAEIVALMVRERLTNQPPPAGGARPRRRPPRGTSRPRPAPTSDRLTGAVEDQKTFARIARAVVRDLQMGDETAEGSDDDADDQGEEGEVRVAERG